ncbi:hypothetical protein, partial [Pseudomonas rossensis]|uniref:hypothetical protein n=1 Tax=Pseudomonas rossensis TaxID=2305471 RepID=UPI00326122BD
TRATATAPGRYSPYTAIRQSPVPTRRTTPLLAEHQAVMAQLPTTLSSLQRSRISLFLCHLEQQSLSWSALAPAAGEVRPAALEAAVNTAITQHGLHPGARPAINRAFNLVLVAPSARVYLIPAWSEHQAVMAQLPITLPSQYRSTISRFLCHLEQQGLHWSTLAPAAGEVRPAALEAAVNTAITQHGLESGTRAAINHAFNVFLQGPSGRVQRIPVSPEHQAVMAQLPTTLSRDQRNKISRFLCHLEQQGLHWSTLAPAAGEVRPAALEAAVNTAITKHGLQSSTRAAINHAFNLALQGPSGVVRLIPVWPEHQAVMAQLPTTLPRQHRSTISRFLCHLEQQGRSWSTLAPAAGEVRPAALEAAVNTAITQHGFQTNTRAAINHAFNVVLRGPSGR